jgi:hypothetical protein
MRRFSFVAAAVVLLTPTITMAGTGTPVEFVSGTVKTIPSNTTGSLDAGGSMELRFRYHKSVFSLPYKNITHTEVTEPVGKHLWRVPVPAFGKSPRLLHISYRDGEYSRMVTFKAPASAITELNSSINAHRKEPLSAAAKEPSVKTDPESWWGDKYWRTNRNKAKWPEVPAENSPTVAAATKE